MIGGIFPKHLESSESKNEINEMKTWKNKSIKMIWHTSQVNTYMILEDFEQDLLVTVLDVNLKFNNKVKPKPKARKKKESNTYETADSLYEGQ